MPFAHDGGFYRKEDIGLCNSNAIARLVNPVCWVASAKEWEQIENLNRIATPPSPTDLLMDPAKYSAQEVIQGMADEQMLRQQNLNKEVVQNVWGGGTEGKWLTDIGDSLGEMDWWKLGLIGVGGFMALSMLLSPSSPRRYGR